MLDLIFVDKDVASLPEYSTFQYLSLAIKIRVGWKY